MEIEYHLIESFGRLLALAPNAPADLTSLTRIISPDSKPVTRESLATFFRAEGIMAAAVQGGAIVGAADLVLVTKRNGFTYRLEHVSVLPGHEGKGIARQLISSIHRVLSPNGRYVDLSCESFRERANALYERLGYAVRHTNSRRFRIGST
ncbi:MAG TPA: GNAT family N-acetyltransferase [Candidatus Paceibacterota bacterium]|nr:GNAT family N-acetyltransferase [Candidatus Paceibacterota bacterium]